MGHKFNSIFGVLAKIIELSKVFLLNIVIARVLGVQDYGVFAFVISISAIIGVLAEFRMQDIVIKNISKGEVEGKVIVNAVFVSFVFALVGMFFIFIIAITFLEQECEAKYLFLYSIIFVFNVFRVFKSVLVATLLSFYIFLAEVASILFSAVLIYFVSVDSPSLESFIYIKLVDVFIVTLCCMYICLKRNRVNVEFFSLKYSVSLVKSSIPLVISGVMLILFQRIDQLMVKDILGIEILAIYSAAINVVTMFSLPPMIISQVLAPYIHKLNADDTLFQAYRQQFVTRICLIGAFFSLLQYLLAGVIISILFGSEYIDAIYICRFLSGFPFIVALGASAAQIIISDNKQKQVIHKSVGALLINIVLNIFMIPSFGLVGAAFSTLIALIISNFISNRFILNYKYIWNMQVKAFLLKDFKVIGK